jgi:hypothetical protein
MKLRYIAGLSGALALAAAVTAGNAAVPAGLQYDEIVRVVIGPATPPPPGAFQSDLAEIANPAPATAQAAPKHRGFSLANVVGSVLSGGNPVEAAAETAAEVATSSMLEKTMGGMLGPLNAFNDFMQKGKAQRYTYYRGWERVDDTSAQTATITKYDRHQIITLDLAKKTYTIVDPDAMPAQSPEHADRPAQAAPAPQPGTAAIVLTRTGDALGARAIDGIATHGYNETVGMNISHATGSCRNGSFSMSTTEYVSALSEPKLTSSRAVLPRVPMSSRALVTRGGCTPTFSAHDSGPVAPSGRLVMYSLVSMLPQNASNADHPSFSFVTERGNVKTPSASALAALFAIPPGFTKLGSP